VNKSLLHGPVSPFPQHCLPWRASRQQQQAPATLPRGDLRAALTSRDSARQLQSCAAASEELHSGCPKPELVIYCLADTPYLSG